jgi:signal transduction histidine kinase
MSGPLRHRLSWLFGSLYWKLSLTFLVILAILAVALIYVNAFTAEMYFQETNQRLNSMVASSIAKDVHPIVGGKIDREALAKLFDNAMVINPTVEVYLLDPNGNILAYSAPDSAIKRRSVNLEPIRTFLRTGGSTFVMGDDPRSLDRQKGFSVARIERDGKLEGYLYAILGGKEFDSVAEMLFGSYILRLGMRTMILTLIAAAVIGLVAFRLITRSLRTTVRTVREFRDGNLEARIPPGTSREVRELATTFNEMAEKIGRHLDEIKAMDTLRRDLVANVSHDLRTPLVSIHGYVETILMKSKTLTEEELHRYLTTVLQSTEKLKKLVEELFELSKLEAKQTVPKLEQFSLAELIQDVAQKYQIVAEKRGIQIKTELPRDLPFVAADIALIERVFQNLLDNAIKYTPEEGVITIRLHAADKRVSVSVADTGCGIPAEELPLIFERYRRGSQTLPQGDTGAGLGLAIVKKILEVHGVSIEVSSMPEEGTSFSFDLPVEASNPQPTT